MSDLPPPPSAPPGGQPEYLGGASAAPGSARPGRRTAIAAVGGVVGVGVIAAGAWAAWSFFASGVQPAEALPDSTLAYVSIDLDPSGGQKIEALQTLRKFPAFKEQVGIDSDDDIREWIFEQVQKDGACADLDYGDDIEPWLGDRFALAAVEVADEPAPVFVVQIKDADAADEGLAKLRDCAGGEGDTSDTSDSGEEEAGAWSIEGDWLVLAETAEIVDDVVAAAADAPLSADDDFTRWTDEAGGDGIVAMYAAPSLGGFLADNFEDLVDPLGDAVPQLLGEGESSYDPYADLCSDDDLASGMDEDIYADLCGEAGGDVYSDEYPDDSGDLVPPEIADTLRDFTGAAAVLRFDDGGLEFEVAADAAAAGQSATAGDAAGELAGSLPEGTAAVFAVSMAEGWFSDIVERVAEQSDASADELIADLSAESGLELPEDAETLLGEAVALAISPDVDLGGFGFSISSEDDEAPSGIGLKIRGDAEAIDEVLDRVEDSIGDTDGFLDRELGDDAVTLGPDAAYRAALLAEGGLGDSDTFGRVVEEADEAAAVLYVDFDAGSNWLTELADDDPDARDNLEPLDALGLSTWIDDDVAHLVLKVTTD